MSNSSVASRSQGLGKTCTRPAGTYRCVVDQGIGLLKPLTKLEVAAYEIGPWHLADRRGNLVVGGGAITASRTDDLPLHLVLAKQAQVKLRQVMVDKLFFIVFLFKNDG
ncbi:MAG: hypothetical protein IPM82_27720 [Saprospiraceae bacterium]|nr:hypothetical protein [Saprospiraceae bacterium]